MTPVFSFSGVLHFISSTNAYFISGIELFVYTVRQSLIIWARFSVCCYCGEAAVVERLKQ